MAAASVIALGDLLPKVGLRYNAASDEAETQPDRPTVLLVDDEPLIVDTLTEILEGAGYYVLPAYDGWTALEKVAHHRPDYLLSDVLMPKMNGVELAIAIRKMHPSTQIVLFSGQAGISDILLDGQRRGFEFELIAKPIHPLKIIEHLKGSHTDFS
jgi:CheY-like chemotaxis protein